MKYYGQHTDDDDDAAASTATAPDDDAVKYYRFYVGYSIYTIFLFISLSVIYNTVFYL